MVEEFYKGICQLMPELAFPEVFEVKHKRLEFLGSFVSLLSEEIGNCVGVHCDLELAETPIERECRRKTILGLAGVVWVFRKRLWLVVVCRRAE